MCNIFTTFAALNNQIKVDGKKESTVYFSGNYPLFTRK